jgi:hypothetical protein
LRPLSSHSSADRDPTQIDSELIDWLRRAVTNALGTESNSMKSYMIVHQKFKDLGQLQRAFDLIKDQRQAT